MVRHVPLHLLGPPPSPAFRNSIKQPYAARSRTTFGGGCQHGSRGRARYAQAILRKYFVNMTDLYRYSPPRPLRPPASVP